MPQYIKGGYSREITYKYRSDGIEYINSEIVQKDIQKELRSKNACLGESSTSKSSWLFRFFPLKMIQSKNAGVIPGAKKTLSY